MGHLDDVLELPRLFLHFGRQEQGSQRDFIAMEKMVSVEHVEPVRVHNRGVDAQLSPGF